MARATKQFSEREMLMKELGSLKGELRRGERKGMEAGPYNELLQKIEDAMRAIVRFDAKADALVAAEDLAVGEWIANGGYDNDDFSALEKSRERYG